MNAPKILVVEDEGIIAQDIKNCLENLGYTVPEVVFTGRDAIEKASKIKPDLVLMDIVLKGEIDGIETAAEIRKQFNIPIVYLTAYEDDKTLKRAKITEPLGYILKPFEERYLRSSIEMALYKHQMENKLKKNEQWLSTILRSVADAVVVTDIDGKVMFMNPVAEELTGWSFKDAYGKGLKEIFNLVHEETKSPLENPVSRVLQDNIVLGRNNHALLISRDGSEISIDHSAAPIRDEKGNIIGVVLVINDISDRRIAENALRESENKYRNLFDYAIDAIFVQSLSGNILSVNNEACRLLKFSKSELYGMKFRDLLPPDTKNKESEIHSILIKQGKYNFETKYLQKTGATVDVEVSMRIIRLLDEDVVQVFVRDVTEKKRSQNDINILAHAVKSISECVSITDLNNKLLFVNDAFVNTYGYGLRELMGKSLNIIHSQKNPKGLLAEIERATISGGWHGELIHRTSAGMEFPVFLSTSVIRDESGNPVALIGVASNITERKRLENALRASEQDYKGLFENAHDAIIIYRPEDEIILDINEQAIKTYGYTKSELIGMTLDTITKNNSRNRHNNHEVKPNDLDKRFEVVHYRKDGTPMYLEITRTLVDYKGQRAIVSINHDISERKKAEEALLFSEKRYQDLYDSAPDIYLSLTPECIIKSVNKFGAEYLGYRKEELLGRNFLTIVHVNDQTQVKLELQRIFDKKEETAELEFRKIRKDGKTLWVFQRAKMIFGEDGMPEELFIICRDITERKRTEEILREREELYRAMFEKNQAIKLLVDPETGSIVDANLAACYFYGYDLDSLKKKSLFEINLLSPETSFAEMQIAKTEENSYFIFEQKLSSGEVKAVEFYTGPIDVKGRLLLYCIVHDITERKRAEEAVLESEKKYKNLAENAPLAVTRIVMETKSYDFVNEEFVRLSGYTMDEFNKLSENDLVEMIFEEDRERVFSFYREWANNGHKGTRHIDYRIVNKYRKLVWLDTYLYADFNQDGTVKALNQICIDVTEQRQAQRALSESEKRFRTLIENSADMIALSDADGNILYASPSTTRILGYPLDEYVGKNAREFIHPLDTDNAFKNLNNLVSKVAGSITMQLRLRHKDGSWLWIEATGSNMLQEPTIGAVVVNYRDITQRKRSEEELILQKSYFQQLFENSPEGIVLMDNMDRIVNINRGFEKMFQYSAEEISGKPINDIIVPQNMMEQASQMSKFVLKGEIIQKETVRKRKDGSLVDVSILAYPITLGNDQIGVYGIYNDISERKQTEKALRNSQERYKAFVQQSTEGIWRLEFLQPVPCSLPVDEQVHMALKFGYLAECNDTLAKMYGFNNADEIVGTRLNELFREDVKEHFEIFRSFVNGGYHVNDAETSDKDKNGNSKYFLNNIVGIIEDELLVRAWGIRRDVTEKKSADEELRKIQFRLATLLSNLPDVVLYETGGGKEFISENVIDLLGYPASKFMGDRMFFPTIIHPGDARAIDPKIKAWNKASRPGILNLEFRCRKADGSYIWLEDHMVSVKSFGEIDHLAGVLINVTEHKHSEEKLKQLAEKLVASNKELEQFAYVASHDLQEPLRMVASYIQLLQRRYKGQLGQEADEFIGFAVDGILRMKTLINDLLIYSRVNTQEFVLEMTDCNKIIEQVIENFKTTIEENNAEVLYDPLPTVKANEIQLTQLFQNLISNAIKFRRDDSPVIRINARRTDSEWLFSVSDNGIGIEKEFLDRIFVIFQRLHSYTEYPGTGIGLAICKKIVEKLGGHIWVESEVGKGSTFYFTVPSAEEIS